MPNELEVRHSATSRRSAEPVASDVIPRATGKARASEITYAVPVTRAMGSEKCFGSISCPARKSKNPRPMK